jgi:hypothetical protein
MVNLDTMREGCQPHRVQSAPRRVLGHSSRWQLQWQPADPVPQGELPHRRPPPLHANLARLTEQEEKGNLLAETASIGTRRGWEARLREAGWGLRGHRLVRSRGT